MGMTHREGRILIVVTGALLLAWHLLRALHNNPNWASNLRRTLAESVTAFLVRQKASSSSVDRLVAQEMTTRRLELARAGLRSICYFCASWVVIMVFNAALDRPRWMTYMQEAAMFLIYGATLMLTSCPRLLPASSLEYWHIYFMVLSFSIAVPLVEGTQTHQMFHVLFMVQFCFGVMSSKLAFVYSVNIIMVLAVLAAKLASGAVDTPCESLDTFQINSLLVNTVFVFLALHGIAKWIEVDARRTILHRSAHSAAESLLNNLCDVVLELDSELRIVSGAAKLATVLLRSGHTTLSGVHLHTVMSSEASERFLRQVQAPSPQDQNSCHIIHVNMRDSCGNPMKMELFSVEFDTLDDGPHRFVGVREFTDGSPMQFGAVAEDAFPHVVDRDGPDLSLLVPIGHPSDHSDEVPAGRRYRQSHNRRLQGGGTPAGSAWEDIGGDAASQVSAASNSTGLSSLAGHSLILANFLPTTKLGKTVVMMNALAAVNVPYCTLTCCRFHCCVEDARSTLDELRKMACFDMDPEREWQCQHCGVMDPDALMQDGGCKVCDRINEGRRTPDISTSL
eukprot:TRINITY_DN8720_c0_g2_i10.p1 TRINITY_DN8720_c0_g2~~TRINITY_DN8720_c0_g2_i10.p1  ORF type:complete len:574 (+),score=64.54 TRINITY_DN8720_c0_g2_i10:30-1724(+)